jgi:hypothetical protein
MRLLAIVLALTLAAVLLVLLGVPAIAFVTSPSRHASTSPWLFVANLADLPEDGQPRRMPVLAPDRDAWTRRSDKVVGAVFVRRIPGVDQVLVLEPHHHATQRVGVEYDEQSRAFQSCWGVRFDLEGCELPAPDLPPMGDRMERLPARVIAGQVFVYWVTR